MIPITAALRLAPYIAGVAAIVAGLAWVDHRAYRSGQAEREAVYHAERSRQIEAAQWAARSGAAAASAAIARERAAAEEVRSITDDARDLDNPCLPVGIVQRLDAIGR